MYLKHILVIISSVVSVSKTMSENATFIPDLMGNETELLKASVGLTETGSPAPTGVKAGEEEPYKVPISQEAINNLLIGMLLLYTRTIEQGFSIT